MVPVCPQTSGSVGRGQVHAAQRRQQPNQWQQPFTDATVAAGDDADVAQLEMMQFLLAGEAPSADAGGGVMNLLVRLPVQASPPSSPSTKVECLLAQCRWRQVPGAAIVTRHMVQVETLNLRGGAEDQRRRPHIAGYMASHI